MTIGRDVTNEELLEEIKILKTTIEQLSSQLSELQLKEEENEPSPSAEDNTELKPGDRVLVLSRAKYGRHGDEATVLFVGKLFVTIKLQGTGRTTTRLPKNLQRVRVRK